MFPENQPQCQNRNLISDDII